MRSAIRRIGRRPLFAALMVSLAAAMASLGACGGDETSPADASATGTGGSGGMGGEGSGGAGGSLPGVWNMGQPFSTDAPTFAQVAHPLVPTERWGSLTGPYPTNAAWMDFVLGTGVNPVNVFPYEIKALANGMEVCLPSKDVKATFILSVFNHDISFETVEALKDRAVVDHDLLSVTMRWQGAATGSMTAPIVRGMPYATMVYEGLTPRIESAHAITSVNNGAASPITADRFEITLNNGQTWILYASQSLSLSWSASGMAASAPFTGVLRVAELSSPSAAAALDAHRAAYPKGGDVLVAVQDDNARIDFAWEKDGDGPLLMMALPHHIDSLSSPDVVDVKYPTLRGEMVGVAGASWTLQEALPTIKWSAPRAVAADKVDAVKAALTADAAEVPVAKDPYFFGKQIAKLGRLALIADELDDAPAAAALREQMRNSLNPWLDGQNDNPLKYDSVWGGICSANGLASQGADFGSGWYNDHHFHYGYFLYAAAALAKGDKAWLDAKKAAITDLARDIANPSLDDKSFTRFRNKDWFEGHSWAAGLFEFADGRNQESTSEAVNAWYGLYLLGLTAGDKNLENVGRVLLATEIRSTQKYWQIKSGSAIYPDPFAANKVVGVLWGNKVDYATFFGSGPELIHGIQMIPFTPITEALLPADWVAEEYPVVSQTLGGGIGEGWKGFIYMDHAVIDAPAAWGEVQSLSGYDDGNTKTNTLYWVATRPIQ